MTRKPESLAHLLGNGDHSTIFTTMLRLLRATNGNKCTKSSGRSLSATSKGKSVPEEVRECSPDRSRINGPQRSSARLVARSLLWYVGMINECSEVLPRQMRVGQRHADIRVAHGLLNQCGRLPLCQPGRHATVPQVMLA